MLVNRPYFLLFLAPLIWGGHVVVAKVATVEVAPMTLTLLRWTVALAVIIPFTWHPVKKEWKVIRQHFLLLFICGASGFASFNMLYYRALEYTTALNVALIQAAIPMLILLINAIIFRHRIILPQVVGLVLAFIGVALVVTSGRLQILSDFTINDGDVLMLLASLMYAVYSIALHYKPSISWTSFIFILAVSAWVTALPFAVYEMATRESVFVWSAKSLVLVLYIGILASIVAQIAYAKGVSMIGAGRGGLAINLVPIFGTLMAVVFLGEAFHWYHLAGLLLVLGGITLSERYAPKRQLNVGGA
ncbi:MAG: EamA family transporter [Gammaproteobacteria bacterium]|nr:MAG: EamA family transporter [Gammaproteobacteria bacterium]